MYMTLGMLKGAVVDTVFPSLAARSHSTQPDGANVHRTISYPAGIVAGQLMVLIVSLELNAVFVDVLPPTGWTLLQDGASSGGGGDSGRIFYKMAVGGEAGTLTYIISSPNTASTNYLLVFSNATQVEAIRHPQTSGDADPSSLSVSWGVDNNLFMALCQQVGPGLGFNVPGIPASYPANCTLYRSYDDPPMGGAIAGQTTTAATFNPDIFDTSSDWYVTTLGLR
jgi:hypothetical protein